MAIRSPVMDVPFQEPHEQGRHEKRNHDILSGSLGSLIALLAVLFVDHIE